MKKKKTEVRYFLFDKQEKIVTEQKEMPSWVSAKQKETISTFISGSVGRNVFLYFCETKKTQTFIAGVKELTLNELTDDFSFLV